MFEVQLHGNFHASLLVGRETHGWDPEDGVAWIGIVERMRKLQNNLALANTTPTTASFSQVLSTKSLCLSSSNSSPQLVIVYFSGTVYGKKRQDISIE